MIEYYEPLDAPYALPDADQSDIRASHEDEQRRKEDNLRWLEEHCAWRPFGVEW